MSKEVEQWYEDFFYETQDAPTILENEINEINGIILLMITVSLIFTIICMIGDAL